VLDVGQGDALYIESPTGVQIIIDGGPDSSLLRALPALMPPLDRTIDAVLATHPDADHIGGLGALLERYQVAIFIEPGITKDTATAQKLSKAVDTQNIPRIIARRGMSLELGDGARLDILSPSRDVSNLPDKAVNEGGIVVRLVYKESSALLMADVGVPTEEVLQQLGNVAIDADVIKIGHHGSKYSSSEKFIRAVSPQVALISVGSSNTYGHPTATVIDRLERLGITTLRTDQKGTIKCVSSGAAFDCTSEK
jgi:competence protein ComEC